MSSMDRQSAQVLCNGVVDNPDVPVNIDLIRRLRLNKGWSQEEAAGKAGLAGKQYWSKIEGGKHDPTVRTLEKIARALNCRPADLLK